MNESAPDAKRPNVVAQLSVLAAIGFVVMTATMGAVRNKALFQSMGVELPWITELMISGGSWVQDQWPFALPLLAGVSIGLTWPLRSLEREKTPHALVIAALVASLGLGVVWLGLQLPIQKLQQSLNAK